MGFCWDEDTLCRSFNHMLFLPSSLSTLCPITAHQIFLLILSYIPAKGDYDVPFLKQI